MLLKFMFNQLKLPEKVLFINGAQKMHNSERTKIKSLAKKQAWSPEFAMKAQPSPVIMM